MALIERRGPSRPGTGGALDFLTPRCVGPIGGTTTLADCLVAMRHLASPKALIQGPASAEYEAAFARTIGVGYAYSFWAGRSTTLTVGAAKLVSTWWSRLVQER
jgi:hypothetical protein